MKKQYICKSNRRSLPNFIMLACILWFSYMMYTIYVDEGQLWVFCLFLFTLIVLVACLDELINHIVVEKHGSQLVVRPSTFLSIKRKKTFELKEIRKAYSRRHNFSYSAHTHYYYKVALLMKTGEKIDIIHARNQKESKKLSQKINKKIRN